MHILSLVKSFSVAKCQIPIACQTCKVLLTLFVDKLQQQQDQPDTAPTVLTTKQLLLPIRALCTGQSLLSSAEEVALISMIKNSKLPPYTKHLPIGKEKESSQQSVKESMRSRCDLSTSILEQLTMPLQDFSSSAILANENSVDASKSTNGTTNDANSDTKVCSLRNFSTHCCLRSILVYLSRIYIYIHTNSIRYNKKSVIHVTDDVCCK